MDRAEKQTVPLKVAITFNLKRSTSTDDDAEFDDISTISAIEDALKTMGCEVILCEATEEAIEQLIRNRPDFVFNIAEGINGRGREAHIPSILNFLGIPFTGSDETTMCLTLDKHISKILVSSYGIKTPDFRVIDSLDDLIDIEPTYPMIIKLNSEGSSKGISNASVVSSEARLRQEVAELLGRYNSRLILEEYIEGREFTVGILGNRDSIKIFEPMEIIFKDKEFPVYGYEVKKDFKKYVEYTVTPEIEQGVTDTLKETAGRIFGIFGCYDMARIDFRVGKDNTVYFIEINSLPGLAPNYSDFPMLAGFSGMEYKTLICSILKTALKRYNIPYHEDEGYN